VIGITLAVQLHSPDLTITSDPANPHKCAPNNTTNQRRLTAHYIL